MTETTTHDTGTPILCRFASVVHRTLVGWALLLGMVGYAVACGVRRWRK
jgi:hypothetical protein